jgi:NitT/TauT family transport system ATP-binding protein
MNIETRVLSHSFQGKSACQALKNLSMDIGSGQFVALLGPSGCGKTTLLRILVNLVSPSSGEVLLDGKTPAEAVMERRVAWMAQSPALLPWLTVAANVDLARRYHSRETEPSITSKTALGLVGLGDVAGAYPSTLSGGMQQRLALARTLIMDASLWLMDEPFAALDELTREKLAYELHQIWLPLQPTVLWVTHNVYEALKLADRVVVLSKQPGEIIMDEDVDLPHPRVESEQDFQDLLSRIRDKLNRDVHQDGR